MAGIRFLDKNPITINYILNRLFDPEIRHVLFDDSWGDTEISMLLYDPRTVIYGIMAEGKPEPIGVVYFSNVKAYRDCVLSGVIFDPTRRDHGIITALADKIKADIRQRFAVHSISANAIGDNQGSKKLLERFGFQKVGVKPKIIVAGGKYQDLTLYYLLFDSKEA